MHAAAKVTLGVGVGMLAIGVLLVGLGARTAGSAEDFSVEDDEVWNGSSGQYVHGDPSEWGLLIFVREEVRCDEFDLNVSVISSDIDGKVWYEHDWCTDGGRLPSGYVDDPEGWLHMGTVRGLEMGGTYEFASSDEVFAVEESQVVKLIEGVFAGILGAMSGGSCACCGLLILLLGVILAFTMKEEAPTSYKVDAEGKIVIGHPGTPDNQEATRIKDGSDGFGEELSGDTDAWYKQN
mgnify:CR=1 FL=1|tara:strand:- start:3992 stop:4702 length:711 start_codon:yes stop_codon:yes gene_type:complete